MNYPCVEISQEMLDEARELVPKVDVERTKASPFDTLAGILGEFVWAQWWYGDWRKHRVGQNKGNVDFEELNVEVKTSAIPFRENLHLLVREEYAKARKPRFYVQVIIDVPQRNAKDIEPGTKAYVVGWATAEEVERAPKRDMGSKLGGKGGYRSHFIPIPELHRMDELQKLVQEQGFVPRGAEECTS